MRLACDDVTRVFATPAGEVAALRGVSLAVEPGELLVVRGPSGAGKTTLLNILAGIDLPTSGSVTMGQGEDRTVISALGDDARAALRAQRIGYVFQAFGLIPVLSAQENVEIPLRLAGMSPTQRRERARQALEQVGLADHVRQRPGELSGGQQQRVGIARALAGRPDVLIADEPTGQLDSETAARVMDLIHDLVASASVAAVVATHDPEAAERADRVLTLRAGTAQPGTAQPGGEAVRRE
ncbi:ABC transporter ATP-binding protein [Serinibacter salmoneus]|uniref:Putative ABC transport system ATP-binding protein n=1 Tax=Serinibacter salmoneus TaxID=556530 RepID=A0A2A9D2C4_9MICO|nr:ABC transporter ATP-binding protein [Serinibacter salmoneus]PFG20395.1 putative ABC transport system ATP-binding protein [Serinibacter salmoneus]